MHFGKRAQQSPGPRAANVQPRHSRGRRVALCSLGAEDNPGSLHYGTDVAGLVDVAVSDVFEKLAAAGTQPFAGDDRVDLRLRKRDDFAGREISADNNGQLA